MSANTKEILVSPDRKNIMFNVELVKKAEELDKLMGLVDLAKKKERNLQRNNLCQNLSNSATHTMKLLLCLFTYFACSKIMYLYQASPTPANRIIGIFHSMTLNKYKERE